MTNINNIIPVKGRERIFFANIGEKADQKGRLGISILDAKSLKGRFAPRNKHVEVNFQGRNVVVSLNSLKEFCSRIGITEVPTTKNGIEQLLSSLNAQNSQNFAKEMGSLQVDLTKQRQAIMLDEMSKFVDGFSLDAEETQKKYQVLDAMRESRNAEARQAVQDTFTPKVGQGRLKTAMDQELLSKLPSKERLQGRRNGCNSVDRAIQERTLSTALGADFSSFENELREASEGKDFTKKETKEQFNALEARSARPIQELREKAERLKLHQDAARESDIKLRIADLDRQFKEINVFEVNSEGERLFPRILVGSQEKFAKAQAARQTAAGIAAKSMHAAKAIPEMDLVMPLGEMFPSEVVVSSKEAQARHAAKVHAEYMGECIDQMSKDLLIILAKNALQKIGAKFDESKLANLSNRQLSALSENPSVIPEIAKTKSHILRNLVLTTAIVGTTALAVCALGDLEASDKDQGITLEDVKNNMFKNLTMAHQTVASFAQQSGMTDMVAAARDSTVNYFQKLFAPVLPKQPMCGLVEEMGNCTASEQPTLVENITNMISSKLEATFTNVTMPSFEPTVEENGFSFASTPANATIPASNECNTTDAPVTMVLRLAKKVAEQAVNLVCRKIENPNPPMCGLDDPMGVCKA